MKLFYHPIYSQLPLPPHHRFPIAKYQGLFDRLNTHSNMRSNFTVTCAEKAHKEQLVLAHDHNYVQQFIHGTLKPQAQKRIGFAYSEILVERTMQSVGNTIGAALAALESDVAINLSGGYHHAFADYGSGYCIFNDAAIAARYLIQEQLVDTVLIVDLDVHQGDGSAAILGQDHDIVTLSLHAEQNFPRLKQCSDYDFALPSGCGDNQYLETLEQALSLVIRLHNPDIILYNAGADVVKDDELGMLALTPEGVFARDNTVMRYAKEHNIALAGMLGGGYQRDVEGVIDVHWQLLCAASSTFAGK